MGICIPPPEFVLGLKQFEHWTYRSQPEGSRSGPGDLDLTIYSLRKYVSLAAKGNPSILCLMYLPNEAYDNIFFHRRISSELIQERDWFVSKDALRAFLGYMTAQKERLFGERGQKRVNRPELVEKYGFDTKYAMHVVRLGIQGLELATKRLITFPMDEPWRTFCLDIRTGNKFLKDVKEAYEHFFRQIEFELNNGDLPEHAKYEEINPWLVKAHQEYWHVTY